MSAAIPIREPVELFAGDSVHFRKELADFPPTTWTLSYRLLAQKGAIAIDLAATADGAAFDVAVAAAVTAGWTAGKYWLIGYVAAGSERVQIFRGEFEVLPNPATESAFDGRSYLQRILELIEETIEFGIIRETIRYSYGGVSCEVQTMKDAFEARERIKAQIIQAEAERTGKQRRILTKFVRPR